MAHAQYPDEGEELCALSALALIVICGARRRRERRQCLWEPHPNMTTARDWRVKHKSKRKEQEIMHRIPTYISQIGRIMLGVALLTVVMSPAEAVVIDFDTLPNGTALSSGTAITTQYQPLGAIFASNGGTSAHVLSDPPEAVSQPNVLVGNDVF